MGKNYTNPHSPNNIASPLMTSAHSYGPAVFPIHYKYKCTTAFVDFHHMVKVIVDAWIKVVIHKNQ